MNAAETVAAAIQKLEALRDAADEAGGIFIQGEGADSGLIVTLYRTIDAQLEVLRESEVWGVSDGTIDLARAILGVTS